MQNNLIGVVACGGSSTRMKTDKSSINYHGKPQRYFLYDLIKYFCRDVFISCNKIQSQEIADPYTFIEDHEQYAGNGPVSGLLSAFKKYPEAAILYIGCDYPFFGKNEIQQLIEARTANSAAVCFRNSQTGSPEPLLAIYENKCLNELCKRFEEKRFSLRDFLSMTDTVFLTPVINKSLISVDTPEHCRKVLANFKKAWTLNTKPNLSQDN